MKKISTLLMGMLCLFGVVNAQDISVFDFDGTTPTFSSYSDTFTSDVNPLSDDAVNGSSNAGKYTHNSMWSDVSTLVSIDPRVYTSFEVSVYTPTSTTGTVVIACYDASGNQLDWYSQPITTAGAWIKYTRNLNFTKNIAKIKVAFNYGADPSATLSDNIVYIDNLVFKQSANPVLYSENFEADLAWDALPTVTPSTKAGKWMGGIDLQTVGDASITLDQWWAPHNRVLKFTSADAAVIIPDINVAGFDSLKLSADITWPYSDAENSAWWSASDANKSPLIDVKIGTGDWVPVPTSVINGWATQVILLKDGSGNPISNVSTISIRISHAPVVTAVYDNVKISGKVHYEFTGGTSTDPTVSTNWTGGFIPGSTNDFTISGGNLVLDQSATYHNITVNPTAKLTLNDTKLLTVSSLLLKSDATGTATFVDYNATPAAISATVQQYLGLSSASAPRSWYICSPVSGASAVVPTGQTFFGYQEVGGNTTGVGSITGASEYWVPFVSGTEFTTKGKGYVVQPGSATTVTFTGTLNTGDVTSPTLSSTGTNTSYQGYNLVGNPYPSYLNVLPSIVAANANLDQTVWYRTQGKEATPLYHFETVNATTGIGTNAAGTGTVTGYIPPLQAFWVHNTTVDAQTITFFNANRSHAGNVTVLETQVPTTLLKARASESSTQSMLRLKVSNGTTGDETVIYTNANATNGYDNYDSQKMSNNNVAIPEIYTIGDGHKLAIDGLNSIPENTELPLGFTTGQSNAFSIKASEFSNFDANTKVYLKDKLSGTEYDLTDGTAYTFASDITSTTDRFSLIFKSAGVATSLNNASGDQVALIYKNANNQITVNCKGDISDNAFISVYNALGQKLEIKQITSSTTVIGKTFTSGVYVVTVNNGGKNTTKKVILN